MSKAEQILLNRVKFIGENEWTLLGCPDDVIKELAKIEREARISELERFAGEHYGDTNPKGGGWCRDVNGKQFKPCVRCSANERIAELKGGVE